MERERKKLLSHILMVVAPLLVLIMLTAAWFISSRTVSLSELSFAAQSIGPGAGLHRATALEGRVYDKAHAKLSYSSITWGGEEPLLDSRITVENMVPGQCEFYLLASGSPFTPELRDVTVTEEPGAETPTLAQCVGLYLIPTAIDLAATPPKSENVSLSLTRSGDGKPLDAALFLAGQEARLPDGVEPSSAYILAVYCDPVYLQNGVDSRDVHTGALPGSISFALGLGSDKED